MSTETVRGVRHPSTLSRNAKARAIASVKTRVGEVPTAHVEQTIDVTPHTDLPHLLLEHLSSSIGTVVHGIDMATCSDEEVTALYDLLLERKVLFFREQHCSEAEHIAFARLFGELEIHPFNPMHANYDEIIPINSGPKHVGSTNSWHSDVMWRMEPSLGSILRARALPASAGGDTLFCDMCAAFEGLDGTTKTKIGGLFAENSGTANGSKETARKRLQDRGASMDALTAFDTEFANIPIPNHPVVRTHPDTGKQVLYVNRSFTRHIVGIDAQESIELLNHLYRQTGHPEYQCRFKWQVGSVAFWDNRSCQHYGVSDYFPHVRLMERVTIAGELPYYKANPNADPELSYPT